MGTSTGSKLPTTGNWPDIKREVTGISRGDLATPEGVSRTLSNYVREHLGGGHSSSYNAQATSTGARFGGFLAGVQGNGLSQTLIEAGLGNLVGKPAQEVMRGLNEYLIGPGSLLEEDIARWALLDYQNEVLGACQTYTDLESAFASLLGKDNIGAIMKNFFGNYLYRLFKTHFSERIMKAAGSLQIAKERFKLIKDTIALKLKLLTFEQDLSSINWRGADGQRLSQSIFSSVLNIFEGPDGN